MSFYVSRLEGYAQDCLNSKKGVIKSDTINPAEL